MEKQEGVSDQKTIHETVCGMEKKIIKYKISGTLFPGHLKVGR